MASQNIDFYNDIQGMGAMIRNEKALRESYNVELPDFKSEEKSNNNYYDDDEFRLFMRSKYGDTYFADTEPNFESPNSFKSQTESDYEEYTKNRSDFDNVNSVCNNVFDKAGLAWSLKTNANEQARIMAKAKTFEEARAAYEKTTADRQALLTREAIKHHCTPADIEAWNNQKHRGPIAQTSEMIVDIRDTMAKGGILAAAEVVVGAGIGAVVGAVAGEGVGALPGAVIGAETGAKVAQFTAFSGAVAQDTYDKEYGSAQANFFASTPNPTKQEYEIASKYNSRAAAGSAAIEAGVTQALGPIIGKIGMKIPGASKITSKLIKKNVGNAAKEAVSLYSKEGAIRFSTDLAKVSAAEVGQENLQEIINMTAEHYTALYGIEEQKLLLKDAKTPEEKAKILADIRARENNLTTLESARDRLILTSIRTLEGGPIFAVGATANVRVLNSDILANKAKAHAQMAYNINKQIDKVNAEEGFEVETEVQTETPTLKGQIEKTDIALEEQTPVQLDRTEAESKVRVKELENQISATETRLENAKSLGLSEQETKQLKLDFDSLTKQKDEEVMALRKIGTEKAIRQAQEKTQADLDKVNAQLEKANTELEKVQNKIETSTGETLTKSKKKEGTLISKIQDVLEPRQQKLLDDLAKLESRTDVESVLKGKTTEISSTTLANIEKKAEQGIERAKAESETKLIQQQKKTAIEKIKGAIKELKAISQGFATGYISGGKEQINETKEVRRLVSKTLREAGIKKSELGAFDSIIKSIVTPADLTKRNKDIYAKVDEVFEKRQREAELKLTDRLRKMIKPLKGKAPKGKMTADIQSKLETRFAFSKMSLFEAKSFISELISKFGDNTEKRLDTETKAELAIKSNNERLVAIQDEINELSAKKEKKNWEGRNKKRVDRIESAKESVKSYNIEAKEEVVSEFKTIFDNANRVLTNGLNLFNLGMKFNDLTVNISENITKKTMPQGAYYGVYKELGNSIDINYDAENTVPHELGHYFDRKLGKMLGIKEGYISLADTSKLPPILSKTLYPLQKLINEEVSRIKNDTLFKKIKDKDKKYVLARKEVFARLFNALYNKNNNIQVTPEEHASKYGKDYINRITKDISKKALDTFVSTLNGIADYNDRGIQIEELEREAGKLERENKRLQTKASDINEIISQYNLPETVADLIYELSLAGGLKEKTAEEIKRFNQETAAMIQTGRDIRAEKVKAKKEQDDALVSQAIDSIQGDNPTDVSKSYTAEEYEARQKEITKKSFGKWVNQCAKAVLRFAQKPTNTWATLVDTLCEDDKTSRLAKILDYVPALRGYYRQRLEYAQKFNEALSEIYGVKADNENEIENLVLEQSKPFRLTKVLLTDGTYRDMTLTKQEAITAWMYLQNAEVRQDIQKANGLSTIYKPEMKDDSELYHHNTDSFEAKLENFLTQKDMRFANKLFNLLDEYYGVVNTFFEEKYFMPMPKIEKYTPLVREQEVWTPEDIGRYNFRSLYKDTPSSFRSRVHNNKPIIFKPINELINRHIEETSFVMAYDDFNRIGSKVLSQAKDIIKDKFGNRFYDTVISQFKSISNPNVFGGLRDFTTTLFRNMSSASIGYNVTSAIKQIMSFPVLGLELTPTEFAEGIADFTSLSLPEMIKKGKFLFDNSPILQERYKNLNIELAMIAKDKKASGIWLSKQWNRLQNNMYILTRYGDTLNTVIGGWANYRAGLKRGLNHEQAMDMVERAVLKYNQSSNVEDQTVLQLKGGLASAITMFKSDVMKMYNAQVATFRNYLKGNISAAECAKRTAILTSNNLMSLLVDTAGLPAKREVLATVIVGQLASLPIFGEFIRELMVTAIASLMQNFGGDDEDEKDKKPFFEKEGYFVDPTANMAKLSYNLWKLHSKGFDKYEDDWWKAYEDFGEPMVKTLGVPAKPIRAVHSLTDPDIDDTVMMRLPTLIWTRRTLQSSYPDIYE